MKNFCGQYCAQGDVSVFLVEEIPSGLPDDEKRPDGAYTLAHSETGHSHVIDGNCVRVFKQDEFISYVEVRKPAEIRHLRAFDRHEPITLAPGKYRIARQREYVPEGFRLAAD